MGTTRTALGFAGEERAVKFLTSCGYEVLERNFRCRHGEIDVIARDGDELVFVEIKTRRSRKFGSGSEAVNIRKQERIIRCAQEYLTAEDCSDTDARYDIVEVYLENGRPPVIEIIKGAFWEDR